MDECAALPWSTKYEAINGSVRDFANKRPGLMKLLSDME